MTQPSRDLTRTMLQVVFIGALLAGCLWILKPFLLAVIWATTIVVATWPLMLSVQGSLGGRRGLAVAVMISGLLLVLLVPLTTAIIAVAQNADRIMAWARSLASFSVPQPPDWLEHLPFIGPTLAIEWQEAAGIGGEGVSARLAPYARSVTGWIVARAGGIGLIMVQFLLTVIAAAVLYADGETAAAGIRRFGKRLAGDPGENAVQLAAQAVRAVAFGVVVTALIQAVLGGIGLAICGVPLAVILVAVMFILGVAQVGSGPVLIPAVAWLYWQRGPVWGTVMLVWTLVVLSLDNFLRPVLIKRGADLPLLLIFAGVVGGLIAFGVIGLFIGPVLLVVGFTLLTAWIAEGEAGAAPSPTTRAKS